MMRSLIIALSKARWAQRLIMSLGIARRVALRFVAGTTPEDAIRAVRELNARGINASLDHLGENTTTVEEAVQATEDILVMLDAIQREGVRANVSVKLSQFGLVLDEELCRANLRRILEHARRLGNFVRIDMEDSPYTTRTIELFRAMRQAGYDNVGIVIQAYLYRSEADICALNEISARVRLCKGAYLEPPEVSFPQKSQTDANYDHLADLLIASAANSGQPTLSADGRIPPIPAIATHDPKRIAHARESARRQRLSQQAVEFQMLYGIRRDLQEQLAAEGYPVRVYVPYGEAWYPYLMRRLAERPANLWFVVSNFFRK